VSAGSLSFGSGGANQVWDYSGIADTGNSITEAVINPASTPYASSYPGTNIALTTVGSGDTSYAYEEVTASKLTFLGNYINVAGFVYYTTPRVQFQYPLSYGDSYANAFAGYSTNGDTISGIDSFTADGYGTLKLPTATYTNVLRMKYVQHYHSVNSGFGYYEDIYQAEYSYYIPGYHTYLFDIEYTANTINGPTYTATTAQYAKNITTGISDIKNDALLSLYPNPAQGVFTIHTDESLIGADMSVVNLPGEEVLTQKLTGTTEYIDLHDVMKGMYMVNIKNDKGTITRKLIVE
jgi:hypothetical protein